MLTGDNRTTARAIATRLNIPAPRVLAEVLPGDKAAMVEQLQVSCCHVMTSCHVASGGLWCLTDGMRASFRRHEMSQFVRLFVVWLVRCGFIVRA